MKSKKDKNVSVSMSLYSIFDEMSSIDYISQFQDHPDILAMQIEDLQTLLHFAGSNYTQKARTILNLSKEFTKSIEATFYGINELDRPLYQMPQLSYPELAYETLKRTTSLQLEQEENQHLDWRAVQTEFQLKFLESKIISASLDWEKCYNSQQRCIQISKCSSEENVINHQNLYRQKGENSLRIDLTLKIQKGLIVWDIKKVIYYNNIHYHLLSFYKNELMEWIRQQHAHNIEESEKHVLSLLYKSIDYVDIVLLFIQLKSFAFNHDLQESDRKNGILNLFDQKETLKTPYLKGKNIKVCFLLPYSNFPPSMILRVDGLNVLKIQFTQQNKIILTIKLKNKNQEITAKKLVGQIKKTKISLQTFLQIVHEVLQCLQTYGNFVSQKVDQFKLDIFLSNRTTNFLMLLKSMNAVLLEEQIATSEAINSQVKYQLSINNMQFSGLYLVFASRSFPSMPPIVTFISSSSQMLLKTHKTQCGFINKVFKNHSSITYEQVMYHMYFLELIQESQLNSNWNVKLVYIDIYSKDQPISYKFKQLAQKKTGGQSSILKKDNRADHSSMIRDYSIHVKISQNFKVVNFIYVTPTAQNEVGRSDPSMSGNNRNQMSNRTFYKPSENQIPQKYFKDTWKEYIKKRCQSQVLKNQYLDIEQLLKATHYILNHLEFDRYIKGRIGIFKKEDMVRLMDQ